MIGRSSFVGLTVADIDDLSFAEYLAVDAALQSVAREVKHRL